MMTPATLRLIAEGCRLDAVVERSDPEQAALIRARDDAQTPAEREAVVSALVALFARSQSNARAAARAARAATRKR